MYKVIHQRPNHFSYLKVMRERNQLCDVTLEVRMFYNIVVIDLAAFCFWFIKS